ncbi:hypothetical protein HCG46_15135 [Labrenzia sp. PO1]|uniref:hypothetical protein n=1 Tax=Labrenzia sp. PO1 TaxID=2720390 RepID=UPI00144503A8|nr:hypothetical protein [Labrenzia sp. PO1]NKI59607.1 hypothetical protein [Labrenzia sp. PO1]
MITPAIRFWRFICRILAIVSIFVAFGLGVVCGTSGIYADGLAELRRMTGLGAEAKSTGAILLNMLDRLDATVNLDKVRTRHGVGISLAEIEGLCETRLDNLESSVGTLIKSGTMRVSQSVSANSLQQFNGIEDLRKRIADLSTRTTSTETFCAQSFSLLLDILVATPTPQHPKATDNSAHLIEERE